MNNPMSNTETVQAFMQALEARDFAAASSYLADDFIFSGATPKPLNKGQFMTVMKELKDGIPDLTFHLQDVHQRDSTVTATMQITGTQTRKTSSMDSKRHTLLFPRHWRMNVLH